MTEAKQWGDREFWGVSFDYDPQWLLTSEQKKLQADLIDLCRTTLRPNAVNSDITYEYPQKNMSALADMGLLGLIVPKELGGRGENHVCAVMVCETIARYGCPSTAMVYVMHIAATATLLLRHHNNETIRDVLQRIDKDTLIGTLVYSDPATGGHFWYPLSSKAVKQPDGSYKVLKYSSWTTSAGFADFYVIQTASPGFDGDYSNLSVFLLFKDEVRASTTDWSALGMHGNQSGPMVAEGTLQPSRLVGPIGDGMFSNDECVDPWFLLLTSSVWNGIAMGCIDIAKKHASQKLHADMGQRVADYPVIQDNFGESVCKTNSCRLMDFTLAEAMDRETKQNDWSLHSDHTFHPRFKYLHWGWQLKFNCAGNVAVVSDMMLHVCGGTGFKTELGIERLLRDGKAGWVMGPSNEVLKSFVGNTVLNGLDAIDYWVQQVNHRAVHTEIKKMKTKEKQELVTRLLKEISLAESDYTGENLYQGSDFDNPFNTSDPEKLLTEKEDAVIHDPALTPGNSTNVKLNNWKWLTDNTAEFTFALPKETDHTGCLVGQFVKVSIKQNNVKHDRYFSPVSTPRTYGIIQLVTKFETHGQFSKVLKTLNPGDVVGIEGPSGGFEYKPNKLDELSLLTSGIGVTPAIQIVRAIMKNPDDKTKVSLIYYADNESEIIYKEELDAYQKNSDQLKIVYTLGECDEKWQGEDGYIDGKMIEKIVPKYDSTKKQTIVICGGPSMVVTVLEYLHQREEPSETIYVYGTFGVEQVRAVYGRQTKLSTHTCDY